MNKFTRICVWLSRITYSKGFGIQSPADYQFVRCVVNEHWPYYEYSQMDKQHDWLTKKMGRLYLRLANWRQPRVIVDQVGAADYLKAGCRTANIVSHTEDAVQMACVPIEADHHNIIGRCTDGSVLVVQDIWKNKKKWQAIENDNRTTICYNLYYCGIALFDSRRIKQSYIVNF